MMQKLNEKQVCERAYQAVERNVIPFLQGGGLFVVAASAFAHSPRRAPRAIIIVP